MKLSFNVVLTVTVLLSLYSKLAGAFCVYNKLEGDSPTFLVFKDLENFSRAFKKEVAQGDHECCPYDNGECNFGRQRDSPIILKIRFGFDHVRPSEANRLYFIECEGGAGISIIGSTQAFCIYNELEGDGATVYAYNIISDESKAFKKNIERGGKECCPFDNGDCNPGGQKNSPLDLHFRFVFRHLSPFEFVRKYIVSCEGGAGITITGSSYEDLAYVCDKSDGNILSGQLLEYADSNLL
ncbi:uncharacterized protein EV154DRAFT_566287 [Mucor mucedo]|uniref:uncharacterized protein n=1 Tax=Mucor mucedo TaxID=29922 RepID=UPI0022205D49|nr:uncharacterized protein EV154DRAFT_566287 [Mucor mucedo]KAI7888529.1 hypothetical protein EV154DRAFT_566287 [Mucor mucedo]